MNENLIFDGNTIYEVDPECMRQKIKHSKEYCMKNELTKKEKFTSDKMLILQIIVVIMGLNVKNHYVSCKN